MEKISTKISDLDNNISGTFQIISIKPINTGVFRCLCTHNSKPYVGMKIILNIRHEDEKILRNISIFIIPYFQLN